MPNHIQSQVEIKGPKELISKLIKDSGIQLDGDSDKNEFDFNAIIPMPEELNITSGTGTDLGMCAASQKEYERNFVTKATWWNERYPGVTNAKELKEFLEKSEVESDKKDLREGQMAIDNLKKYGHKDWYSWRNANWGTKWNAYDVRYIAHDDNHLVLEITTAWDTPRGIWDALNEQGFEVNGRYYGEMEGTDNIGDGGPFYVEWDGDFSGYNEGPIDE